MNNFQQMLDNINWEDVLDYIRPNGNIYTKLTFYKDGDKISCHK